MDRPNIIFINVDQLGYTDLMLPQRTKYLKTPNIDRIINNGTSFANAYAAEPVCQPARASWWSGLYPSEHGSIHNSTNVHEDVNLLSELLKNSGYNTYHTGKWHVPGKREADSFEILHKGVNHFGAISDHTETLFAIDFLRNYKRSEPFFLNIGYLNPHDICFLTEHGLNTDLISPDELPELPDADKPFKGDELKSYTAILKRMSKEHSWSINEWRYFLWKYYRLIETVDAEIGLLLDEIERSPYKNNTVIIFTSDHGEGMGHHDRIAKAALWDEAARVPFVISTFTDSGDAAGICAKIKKGRYDNTSLVSGVDLFPTVCGLAGIISPGHLHGLDLTPVVTGEVPDTYNCGRRFIYAESVFYARMIRTDRYKYIMEYTGTDITGDPMPPCGKNSNVGKELLYDMIKDKYEKTNLADKPEFKELLNIHRNMLFKFEEELKIRPVKSTDRFKNVLKILQNN